VENLTSKSCRLTLPWGNLEHGRKRKGMARPSSSTTGCGFRVVEVMKTSLARSTSAGINVPSAMVYPGTRHGGENGGVVAVNISTGA
jgi:hypothetical protein